MYLDHFGLNRYPFTLTPDTDFFLDDDSFRDVLDVLEYTLSTGEGFTKVTGEVGTGKTLMCRKLLNSLDERFVTAYLPIPANSPMDLFMALADELAIKHGSNVGQPRLLNLISKRLLALHAKGKTVVLLVDEAQSLSDDGLEALRLLSNFETEKNKLLQLVLFAQPDLNMRLNQRHLRPIRQRILFGCTLRPLRPEMLHQYLHHRLQTAGYEGAPLFRASALDLLQRASGGVPRLLNVLAHKSLLAAFGLGSGVIEDSHVRRAIADTDGIGLKRQRPKLLTTLFCLLSMAPLGL